ncbi:hypothetical protein OFR22_06530 [Brachyspira hyodysenteriae]|uniref:Uncharacterized protein n=1 Tax=Brachyspira hyodysenteriae (strain ATCC 49526 / WA1) TaxID=565034 RepID=A0A3B6VHD9_BRAHW|nr:hypothetical protein [Brachyspira hyodysenteriae]ACN83978.1 hypothetical protein BHWA1_01508 [Brachyspira hyodysenteriae WA1]KLI16241.1 hypothetical protein SU45_08200 [Brachyspira hyodysenteriae]KLI44715.1 hypothetical protein SZ53_03085 [Brachyspira hyodysenteriae]KLI45221.1 hypothetical protein SZ40_06820 [Brachyspira hyodysenteriae]KLI55301.1 hypothetical protein SZ45_09205 [Brachyspira hyodysenteriae]
MKFLKTNRLTIILIFIIISYIFYNDLIKNNTNKEINIYNLNYIVEDNYIIEDNYNTDSDIEYQNIRRYRDVDLDLEEDRVFIMFTGSLIIGLLLSFILLLKNSLPKKELIAAKIILIVLVIITGLIIFINYENIKNILEYLSLPIGFIIGFVLGRLLFK